MATVLSVPVLPSLEVDEEGKIFVIYMTTDKSYIVTWADDVGAGLLCFKEEMKAEGYRETFDDPQALEVHELQLGEAQKLARKKGLDALFLVEDDPNCPRIIWID